MAGLDEGADGGGQLELLGMPVLDVAAEAGFARRKAGRPPGARNKRVEDIARLIDRKLGDARLHQAVVATMDIDELAARLGCSRMEAAVERRLAFVAVAPFLYQRQPIAVDVTNHRVVSLTIHVDAGEGAVAADATMSAQVVQTVEYQRVDGGADGAVAQVEVAQDA